MSSQKTRLTCKHAFRNNSRISRPGLALFHYAVFDGEAKLLSISADIGTFAKEHKSGAESWRSHVFNFEKKSACTVVSIVKMIKNFEKAKSMMDIQPKIATLERMYIEFAKGFNESDDADIKGAIGALMHMTTVGYFDVFSRSLTCFASCPTTSSRTCAVPRT